ncbi:MAG: LacI family DNA-binding transcriptional regulator [Lentisphaeria bacterium]|nr:LacI family DNA-binding transcriptional regulator [Lentisphaeria bacterium]
MASQVTMKDIAREVGVDVSVVSVVLNRREGRIGVSGPRREQILETARKLGYMPNTAARQLKGKESRIIGLVMPNWTHETPGDLRRYISEALCRRGYQTFLTTLLDDEQNPERAVRDLLSRNIDGIIFANSRCELKREDYPVPIVTGYDNVPLGDLGFDLAHGTRIATDHLLGHGHRKIVYMTNRDKPMKRSGWETALRDAGIAPRESWFLELTENFDFRRQLDSLIKQEGVTAVVCCNDFFAGRLIWYLTRHGYKVPEDIAVTGFDGTGFSQCMNPPLTTVVLPVRELAERYVELMLARLDRGDEPPAAEPFRLKPHLHIAASCGCRDNLPDIIYWREQSVTLDSQTPLEHGMPELFRSFEHRADKTGPAGW